MTNLDSDALSRDKIVNGIDKNYFVEAGAGSGKTTMLVNRMTAMVESGIDISNICAITFTKAAAGEFYERFQKLLIERSNPDHEWNDEGRPGSLPKPTEDSRRLCEEALQKIDLCFMGTIDSFCNLVLSEHPSEAGIPSDSVLISDEDAEAVYRQLYVSLINGESDDPLTAQARIFQMLHSHPEDVFAYSMVYFMNHRNVHYNYDEPAVTDIDAFFAGFRSRLIDLVGFLKDHKELKYDGNDKSVKAWDSIDDIYRNISREWSVVFNSLGYDFKKLEDINLIHAAENNYSHITDVWFEKGRRAFKFDRSLVPEFDLYTDYKYNVTMSLLYKCVRIMDTKMKERGFLTYFDYLYYLRNMLKKDAQEKGKLISYVSKRHSYYLIDEFQDTDPMQAEVFFYLAAKVPDPDWTSCVPRPGSLFIVGDPKQSIYRFRNADVDSFLKVKSLFTGTSGEVLSLSRNFRSKRTLCEYYNRVFTVLMPEPEDDQYSEQSVFEQIPLPEASADEFQGVYKYKCFGGDKAKEQFRDKFDDKQIPQIIERLYDREGFVIRGKGEETPRRIRYGDFMVITGGKDDLAPIMRELKKKNIPFRVEGKVPFEENAALKAAVMLYSAIADPGDAISLYGVLTGPVYGFTDKELSDYLKEDNKLSILSEGEPADDESDSTKKIRNALAGLKDWSSLSLRLTPAALFARVVDSFSLINFVDADSLEVLYYSIELMHEAQKTGAVVSLSDGAVFLKDLITGNSTEERCLCLTDNDDRVHLANLHKVKGLEAPIVIMAGASASKISPELRIDYSAGSPEGYVFSMKKRGERAAFFGTGSYQDQKELEKRSLGYESVRLMYVGATRARNVLIIGDRFILRDGKETRYSRWDRIIEPGTPDFFDSVSERTDTKEEKKASCSSEDLYRKAAEEAVLRIRDDGAKRDNEKATFVLKNPSKLKNKMNSKLTPADSTDDDTDPDDQSDVHLYPALLGTAVHRLMEMLVSSKGASGVDASVTEIIHEYDTPSNTEYMNCLDKALREVGNTMLGGGYAQTNGLPKDLFSVLMSADEVYCEVPFSYKYQSGRRPAVMKGVMDVIYRKGSDWHIVDYKTGISGDDLDKNYEDQLHAYVDAFKSIAGFDADAHTYYIDI